MAQEVLRQFGVQRFRNSCRPMGDVVEYHDYTVYGVICGEKAKGFCCIEWKIEFSGAYVPLSHIIIGIADEQYKRNADLEQDVPVIKYGIDMRCRSGKVEHTYIIPDSESVLIIMRDEQERIIFVGEQADSVRNGLGVEFMHESNNFKWSIGLWEQGVLKYRFQSGE